MASESETVAEIVSMMRDARNLDPSAIDDNNHLLSDWYYDDECQGWLSSYADRIEAAHKREVAELCECLSEAIYSSCVKCKLYNSRRRQCSFSSGACDDIEKWRKALEGANDGTSKL